jgi:hypothetical protein
MDREAKRQRGDWALFGYRNIDGYVRVQSWCHHCRSKNPNYIKWEECELNSRVKVIYLSGITREDSILSPSHTDSIIQVLSWINK